MSSVVSISGGITAHGATPAPEVTKAERDPVLDLVRAWEDSDPLLAVGRIAREALIRRIILHARQAVHLAEKRAEELEQRLHVAMTKLEEHDVLPCAACGTLTEQIDGTFVDAHGLYCTKDCGVTDGALCWVCQQPTDGEEDGLCSEACAKTAAAEDRANA